MKKIYFTTMTLVMLAIAVSLTFALTGKGTIAGAVTAASTQSVTLPNVNVYALSNANQLFILRPGSTSFSLLGNISGLNNQEQVLGMDFRPANNLLYAFSDQGNLYVFNNLNNGSTAATRVSTPIPRYPEGVQSMFDFNPMADAVRLQGTADTNYAIVSNGGVLNASALQTTLAYAPGDRNQGADPNIVGGTYTNNFPNQANTIYFAIDSVTDSYVTIATRNATGSSNTGGGQLQTIGLVNDNNRGGQALNILPTADMDCYTDQNLVNTGILLNGNQLCSIALSQYNVNTPVGQSQNIGTFCVTLSNNQNSAGFIDVAAQTQARAAAPAPTPAPAPGGNVGAASCSVSFVAGAFPNGFQSTINVTNNGPALNGWTLNFNFGGAQRITSIYNAQLVSQSGTAVTLRNAIYNANFPSGATFNLGFGGSLLTGAFGTTTNFALNGVPCTATLR